MILNSVLAFINAMGEVIDMPHLYRHFGIILGLWLLFISATLIDLWDAIYTARLLKQRIFSHKLRMTINKLGEYWRIMLLGFVFDLIGVIFPWYAYPYLSILICVGIVLIEMKSVWEHAKKRKSKAAELPKMIERIVECGTKPEAQELIKQIREHFDDGKKE